MKFDKKLKHKKSDSDLHRKTMSKNTRFASEPIFRSHQKNAWLLTFYPILSENTYFLNDFYPKNKGATPVLMISYSTHIFLIFQKNINLHSSRENEITRFAFCVKKNAQKN